MGSKLKRKSPVTKENINLNVLKNGLKLVKVIKGEYALDLIPPDELNEETKITILSDSMFKTMFANANRPEYSAKFISYNVNADYEYLLNNIKLINSELDKEKYSKKGERADYVAEINETLINIEVNFNNNVEILERNIDFSHRLYSRKIKVGSRYKFTPCIQLNICNFKFENIDEVKSEYYIQDSNGNVLTDKLRYVFIFIPNLRKKWYNKGTEALSEEERFLLSLVEPNILKAKEIGKGDAFMLKGIEDQIEFGKETEILEAYDKDWALKDWGFNEGHKEGLAKGIEKGIEKGQEKGELKGKSIIIKNMFSNNMSIEEISKIINLPIVEIKELLDLEN